MQNKDATKKPALGALRQIQKLSQLATCFFRQPEYQYAALLGFLCTSWQARISGTSAIFRGFNWNIRGRDALRLINW